MSKIITPSHELGLNSYEVRLHSVHTDDNRRFVSPNFNKISKALESEIVLEGFEVGEITHTDTDITVTINPGRLITDNTLVEVDEPSTVTYPDAQILDPEGSFLVMTHYENNYVSNRNAFRINFIYVDRAGNPFDFFTQEKNRMVLAGFKIEKDNMNNIENIVRISYKDIVGIRYTWESSSYFESEDGTWNSKLIHPNVPLLDDEYSFEFRAYDCDSSDDARLRIESKYDIASFYEVWGDNTANDDWVTQSGIVNIEQIGTYNILAKGQGVDMTDFKLSGRFPFTVGGPYLMNAELNGGLVA